MTVGSTHWDMLHHQVPALRTPTSAHSGSTRGLCGRVGRCRLLHRRRGMSVSIYNHQRCTHRGRSRRIASTDRGLENGALRRVQTGRQGCVRRLLRPDRGQILQSRHTPNLTVLGAGSTQPSDKQQTRHRALRPKLRRNGPWVCYVSDVNRLRVASTTASSEDPKFPAYSATFYARSSYDPVGR